MFQDVQTLRLMAEGRIRSANKCAVCGGKKTPKDNHECTEGTCTPKQCAHCDGTGDHAEQMPEAFLLMLGVNLDHLRDAEKAMGRTMAKLYRKHPYYDVIKECDGIGDVLGAQLIGMVQDFNRFQNPSRLQSYLGLKVGEDGKAVRLQKGVQATFRPEGKVWAYKVADQLIHWGKKGRYGDLFRQRAEFEIEKEEKGAKRRAARWTVKRMLRDVWCKTTGHEIVKDQWD